MRASPAFLRVVRWFLVAMGGVSGATAQRLPHDQVVASLVNRKPALQLLQQVESAYGHSVEVELVKGLGRRDMNSIENGAPVIRIDSWHGLTPETVVDELFLLQLKSEGWPTIEVQDKTGGKLQNRANFYVQTLWDQLENRVFFPKMHAMGFDPDAATRSLMKGFLAVPPAAKAINSEGFAVTYMQVILTGDKALSEQTVAWVQNRRNWAWGRGGNLDWSLAVGAQMAEAIQHSQQRPEPALDTFLNCSTLLNKGQAPFRVLGWRPDVFKGGRLLRIEILPTP